MPSPIIIHPYDPNWPRIYEREKTLITETLGSRLISIEHIGSTSVYGLSSKNIIDLIVGVASKPIADECQRLLEDVSYNDVTVENLPEWFYCLGKRLQETYCHLHLVLDGSQHHRNHIIFRDWLRSHVKDAEDYENLKMKLSVRFREDRVSYTNAKNDFIQMILSKALKN